MPRCGANATQRGRASACARVTAALSAGGGGERETKGKKLDQSLSGERFNEDDLIRSARRSCTARLSGFSRQSLAASQVARIVGNCFRNPAQMRSRECSSCRLRIHVYVCLYVARKKRGWRGGSAAPRRAAPILMCESLGTITAITGPVASQHTIRVRGHFVVSHALFHSRFAQILRGLSSLCV